MASNKEYSLMGEDVVYAEEGNGCLSEVSLTLNDDADGATVNIYVYRRDNESEYNVTADLKDVLANIPADTLIENLSEEVINAIKGKGDKEYE